MTKEEIDQVKNWTSDEARQYFIDQEKEIEKLIAGRTKSEEAFEGACNERERLVELQNKEVERLKAQLKSIRNSTIDSCIEKIDVHRHKYVLEHWLELKKTLNALKK